ncbi:hypothetical protein FNF27_00375 [Cafeteria roenbergensis]|uniref:Uncharacterized protein n=1 Tax=Cafeteria roenbergensis TaxID=33653 RepID=A0A5A8EPJ9_CAFRO|nr:hypothetical protein FNF27_00375 [Cafeteria roenbergensis]
MLLRRIPLVLRVFPTTAPLSRAGQRRRQSTPDFAGRLATQSGPKWRASSPETSAGGRRCSAATGCTGASS